MVLYIWVKNEQSFSYSVRETTSAVVVFDSYGYLPIFLENKSVIASLAVALLAG